MRRLVVLWLALSTVICAAVGPSSAGALPQPAGQVVLRVPANIANSNGDGGALFDMASLDAPPAAQVVAATAWTEGGTTFEGVLRRDLMGAVGAEGSTLHARAINDYAIGIPAADVQAYDVLIAYRMNGAPMPVRDKGPALGDLSDQRP